MFTANQDAKLQAANRLVEARTALLAATSSISMTKEDRKNISQCVLEIDIVLARLISNGSIDNDLTPTRGVKHDPQSPDF